MDWRNKPALVAESITRLEEQARWSEKAVDREGVLVGLVSLYYVPDLKALSGQQIELEGVPVQQRMGEGLWVGANHASQVFVAPGDAKMPDLQQGDRVDVTGTVREMPSAEQAIQRWKLQPKLASEIQEEVVYIEAQSLKKNQQPSGTAQADKTKSP